MSIPLEKISLKRLEFFYDVVKHGSITAAAAFLKMPITTLSREIKLLEETLGTPLKAKDKKKISLTEDGKKLATYASNVLQAFYNLEIGGVENHVSEIIIAAGHGTCEIYLPKIIDTFYKEYPDIKIIIKAGPDNLNFTSSHCDIVIGPNLKNRPDLSQTFLKEFKYFFHASREYLAQNGTPTTIEDLKKHKLLLYDINTASYIKKINASSCNIESNSYRTLIELGKLNQGIFPLTGEGLREYLGGKSDFVRLLSIPCDVEQDYFIYHKHSTKLMIIKKIKDITERIIN